MRVAFAPGNLERLQLQDSEKESHQLQLFPYALS